MLFFRLTVQILYNIVHACEFSLRLSMGWFNPSELDSSYQQETQSQLLLDNMQYSYISSIETPPRNDVDLEDKQAIPLIILN